MNNKTISVIVPIYNIEQYLRKCIDSILNQTYKDLEIILVDDGSPDKCPDICDEYTKKDSRIKVIHKANGGLSDARNAGLDIAQGEYISFIDSDDYIDEYMYEDMLSAIENSDADLCICGYDRVNGAGEIRSSAHYRNAVLSRNEAYEMLVQGNVFFIISCNKLYKRKIFNDLRFKVGKTHEDEFIMHHVYGECDKIVTLEKPYYYYLVRESSITGSVKGNVKHYDAIEAYVDRMAFYSETDNREFAARMIPITLSKYLEVKRIVGTNDSKTKERSLTLREAIIETSRLIDKTLLHLSDRIGIKAFFVSDGLYAIWRKFIDFVRRKKISFINKG